MKNLANIKTECFNQVESAYANNSVLYQFLEKSASLQEIVTYLYWDSLQPTFKNYIERWLVKTPDFLRHELAHHIAEEEGHSELFSTMMSTLLHEAAMQKTTIDTKVDQLKLDILNYTFSPECVAEKSFGFFCGGFYATERMAGKRYDQLLNGLKRFDIPRSDLEFMVLHSACESVHSMQALDDLILPLIKSDESNYDDVIEGIHDRLDRSETYIKWYEKNKLAHI